MPRDAALTAKLGLDDSDVRKKVRAQSQNYQDLLRENQRYKERLAQQNTAARAKELREEKNHNAALIAENRKAAAAMLAGSGPARPSMPDMVRRGHPADIRSGSGRPGGSTSRGSGGGATNAGMGMLMLSQTADDLQYVNEMGLRPIINNIAPLVMGLGGSAGLAGAIQIVAIAVQFGVKAWDSWNAKAEIAANNTANLAEYQRNLAASIKAAGDAGAASGIFETDRTSRQDAGRTGQDRILTRQQRLLDLQKELGLAESARLDGVQKLQKQYEINTAAERQRLTRELQTAQDRLTQDTQRLGDVRRELNATRAEIAELEADRSRTPGQDRRLAYLKGQEPGLNQTANTLDTRGGSLVQQIEDIKNAMGPEDALKKQIHDAELATQRAKDTSAAYQKFFGSLGDLAKAAGQQMQDINAKIQAAKKQTDAQTNVRETLRIAELRHAGKNKAADAAQKALAIRSRTAALQAEGFSPAEAADIANREAAASTGKRPGIHGAISPNRKTGLDSATNTTDFAGFQDRSVDYFGLKEQTTQRRTQQNQKLQKLNEGLGKATAAGDNATVAELRALKQALVTKLDELNNTTRGTTADQAAPADIR